VEGKLNKECYNPTGSSSFISRVVYLECGIDAGFILCVLGYGAKNLSKYLFIVAKYLYFCRPFAGVAQLVRASDS
jgi:hypothetical protein